MNISLVDQQTKVLIELGHRIFQIHRFADGEVAHIRRLERWSDFPYGASVIDMGSGTGEVSKLMYSIRPDLKFCLVNISQLQLDYSPPEMSSHCCDFCNVPEIDKKFDGVMFCFSIGHSDTNDAMREAYRLLKSGGVLFIYDMVRISGSNNSMNFVEYHVDSRIDMEHIAGDNGFKLDFYMEPQDNGQYGKSVLDDEYETIFNGTIPAIWRFIKC